MEITGDLCAVFDKTDGLRFNKSYVHYCYVTMRSICCQGDKSLAPVSQSAIGDWSHIIKTTYGKLRVVL